MTYPFMYKVEIVGLDGLSRENAYGVTFSDNFVDATRKVEDYYGGDLVKLELFPMEENNILEVPKSTYYSIINNDSFIEKKG